MKKLFLFQAVFLLLFLSSQLTAYVVPDTGQTRCYNNEGDIIECPADGDSYYGQDAHFQINPPSFTTESVSVKDNLTGLTWEAKTDANKLISYTLDDANAYISGLNVSSFRGYTNWRLPTIYELQSIVNYSKVKPSIDTGYYPGTANKYYWSSTTTEISGNTELYLLSFDYGRIQTSNGPNQVGCVRAVRGDCIDTPKNYIDNMDGSITDLATGLMWELKTEHNKYSRLFHDAALEYCTQLDIGGHNDWRLPTVKELVTLIDYTKTELPMIYTPVFKNTTINTSLDHTVNYWTSTTSNIPYHASPGINLSAWYVNFQQGVIGDKPKYDPDNPASGSSNATRVRAVRGGQKVIPGSLVITNPKPGSTWYQDQLMSIKWENPASVPGNVSISISSDGGKTFTPIIDETGNDGHFEWKITDQIYVNCVLKITPLDKDYASKGTSAGIFYIECTKQLHAISDTDETREEGTTAIIDVRLNICPDNTVAFHVVCSDESEASLSPKNIIFSKQNWHDIQKIKVTGVDDSDKDGEQEYSVQFKINPDLTLDTTGFSQIGITEILFRNSDDDSTRGVVENNNSEGDTSGGCFIKEAVCR